MFGTENRWTSQDRWVESLLLGRQEIPCERLVPCDPCEPIETKMGRTERPKRPHATSAVLLRIRWCLFRGARSVVPHRSRLDGTLVFSERTKDWPRTATGRARDRVLWGVKASGDRGGGLGRLEMLSFVSKLVCASSGGSLGACRYFLRLY